MANTKITFYPVKNGDCCLLEFSDEVNMMFDCNFRSEAEEDNDDYNVIDDLLKNKLKSTVHRLPYLNVFVLSHPDQDHCRNFAKKFYYGSNPEKDEPSKENIESKRILIGELWYSPRVFTEYEEDLSDDAKAFKDEAERRMKLWRDGDPTKDKSGNRIRIIGYTDDDSLKGIPFTRITVPGNEVNEVDGKKRSNYRMFIHAPFKDAIDNATRNETSIVMQIRIDVGTKTNVGKILLGGDAEWRIWDKIMNLTSDDRYLKWNIFEAPHHCSYSFFADDRDDDPNQASLDLLDKKEGHGYIVSSSKTIKKNNDNPPCQKAKNQYVEYLDSDKYFKCTEVDDKQKPVVFEVLDSGVSLSETKSTEKKKESIATAPHYYG